MGGGNTAQLVTIGIAGGLAATGVGLPVGFLVGSVVGNLLFPPKAIISEGPRLGDLTVSTSTYGIPKPIGFGGAIRQAGNVIWAQLPLTEKKTTIGSGGKGAMSSAPEQKQKLYSYFGTFAVGFGEGVAEDILRIWLNKKLVFDKRGTTTATRKTGLNFRWYPGDETQVADASIIASEGATDTPAFRGTIYIVFDDLALADYGNALPQNIEAEIAYLATPARLSEKSTNLSGTTFTGYTKETFMADFERGNFYVVDIDSLFDPEQTAIRKFRADTLAEVAQQTGEDALDQTVATSWGNQAMGLGPDGNILQSAINAGGGNVHPVVLVDGDTLTEIARFQSVSGTGFSKTGFAIVHNFAVLTLYTLQGKEDYIFCGQNIGNDIGLLFYNRTTNTLDYVWDSNLTGSPWKTADPRVISLCRGKSAEGFCEGYALSGNAYSGGSVTDDVTLYKITVLAGAIFDEGPPDFGLGVTLSIEKTFTPADLFPGRTELNSVDSMFYDETDDTVIFWAQDDLGNGKFFKYDVNDGVVQKWKTDDIVTPVLLSSNNMSNSTRLQGATLGYIITDNGVLIDTTTGELLFNNVSPDYTDQTGTDRPMAYDSATETLVTTALSGTDPLVRYFFRRSTVSGVSVGTVVKNIAERVGYTATTDLDTTDIDALTTDGYAIGRQSTARGAITPLANVYIFDGVESDDKLKFVQRGAASIRNIPEADFAPLDKDGRIVNIARTQEVELPERLSLSYLDKDNDYLPNSHTAKRIASPFPTMKSDQKLGLEFPGALDVDFAKQQIEKNLYASWVERSNYSVRLPWKHLDLDPTDVVTLTFDNGSVVRGRIAEHDFGANFVLETSIIGEDSQQFVSSVLADAGRTGVPGQSIDISAFVTMKLFDTPLLRDGDEVPGRASNPIYAAMGGTVEGGFRAGTAYLSVNGQEFTEEASFVSEMNWGSTVGALGDPAEVFQTDTINTLTISMVAGESALVSITETELLNNGNAAILRKANGEVEVINFQTVVDNGDGTFTLSTLLRGRRGTDTMAFSHGSNELFILLLPEDLEKILLTLAALNNTRFYKAVGPGQIFENAELQTLVSEHRALKPYAVVQQTATPGGSNSIDFAWVRRTRVSGELIPGTLGAVPLSEDTEEYEIDIKDGPGGTIVRTVTGLTTPAYNYTSADQTTDGFTPPLASIDVEIFQISAQVGRGFAKEVNLLNV